MTNCLGGRGRPGADLPVRRSAVRLEYPRVPGIDRPIGHATGTSPAVAHDGWRFGALVLVITQRPTHYEGVPVLCSRVQSPRKLYVRRLLLVVIVGC